jgi:hypothetical protein
MQFTKISANEFKKFIQLDRNDGRVYELKKLIVKGVNFPFL